MKEAGEGGWGWRERVGRCLGVKEKIYYIFNNNRILSSVSLTEVGKTYVNVSCFLLIVFDLFLESCRSPLALCLDQHGRSLRTFPNMLRKSTDNIETTLVW
jgi:hypothetical protein